MNGGGPIRAAIVCPGRGSYGRTELGSLSAARAAGPSPRLDAMLAALDERRAARGLEPLLALDTAPRFSARTHLRADNASALILAGAAADLDLVEAAARTRRIEPVVVCGNSLGWYTALWVAGALDTARAARLVDTMAALQVERGVEGGQLVYPVVDDETWRPDAQRQGAVERALEQAAAAGGRAWISIRLGGSVVLAGDDTGLRALTNALPVVERRGRRFPLRLAGHSAFHTPLMAELAATARERLASLRFDTPRLPLVDGSGRIREPLLAAPSELWDYTLGMQVTETYDFTRSVRVALREFAPDLLILLGPGNSLGGPVGQILVEEGWHGLRSRAAFLERQRGPEPIVLSLGRTEDRERLHGLAEIERR